MKIKRIKHEVIDSQTLDASKSAIKALQNFKASILIQLKEVKLVRKQFKKLCSRYRQWMIEK